MAVPHPRPDPAADAGPSAAAATAPFVSVRDLTVRFVSRDADVKVINGVSFDVRKGEVLCLLGESGSGKSVTMRTLIRLLPPTARLGGAVTIDGIDVLGLAKNDLKRLRGSLAAMIFQEPMTALDPVFTIGQQIGEALVEQKGMSWADARARALQLLELVQIPSARRRLDNYPHELSGGLRQRAMIALALSLSPKLLLADEPTTALDATVQIQVLLLLRELQKELGMATVFVTHDLGVAAEIADRIGVMYAGRLVELGEVAEIMDAPRHPYTEGLMRSTVHAGMRGKVLDAIPGAPPDLADLPPGCAFAPRCRSVREHCLAVEPAAETVGPGRIVRCLRHGDDPAYAASAPLAIG
ncbi:ABC transporter ATP-binding protein [Prosthecodimorpha staleyi]|uniref:ABC transporter ATP-binding protein n=1 Tax=Prosthecodimorpha staleyi TaxID=2840188 RepID=A0A947GCY5_9HYPH|nr:ABC transporter ATP-binding protein [Prosthecodimorpha staleyi]MBT9289686.1 ABC transporter ATP-binding protein [Prosthecodimorpha staleyi]